ncbi:MAG: NAD(P)/FAD-dependent oxidoreductase [Candidatus Uhrbacteria bacterium]|nr:NAD(P)/FAD-dependent oxidoreductase [Candidatus Uhrbacteria bacterium]
MTRSSDMRIAIIGGGAAGLMAAATILETSETAKVILIERNPDLGKKVKISGGGRCNVTTGIQDVRTALFRYPRGGKFLTSAMHAFPPGSVMEWFESHGVPLKIEDDLRVFPKSDHGEDVVRVFERLFDSPRVQLLMKMSVAEILHDGKEFTIALKEQDPVVVDRVIIATGGQAYRQTGSTGDGYAFAASLGHTITPLAPSLSALHTKESWPAEVSGSSFASARLSVPSAKAEYTGPFLFTHKGVSGPAAFALSAQVAFVPVSVNSPIEMRIDLYPEQSIDALYEDLVSRVAYHPKKSIENILATFVSKSLADVFCRELGLANSRRPANEVSKKDLRRIVEWLKGIPLHVIARGGGDEFVTAGGVALDEVDPKTLESKKCPGLFFAGEVLDIDGYTGGFNLQASWATGRAAGLTSADV